MPKTKGKPTEIDAFVGRKVREARTKFIFMSQEKLGEALGITFQQIQKYERGVNRVSAGRLAQISRITERPISWFYPSEYQENSAQEYSTMIKTLSAENIVLKAELQNIEKMAGAACQ